MAESSQSRGNLKAKSKKSKGREPSTPGVQKLKSSLRQTRRMLSKDTLTADVRVAAERRQMALETELISAEAARKEAAFATRYHKIKFFERQKVMRRLNQTKKLLTSIDTDGSTTPSSRKQLEDTLTELRVDLNYILHYPRTKKYISLFPPELRQHQEPKPSSSSESSKTNSEREEVRSWIREQMQRCELSSEPDKMKEKKGSRHQNKAGDWDGRGGAITKTGKNINVEGGTADVVEDNFFGEDDEMDEDDEVA